LRDDGRFVDLDDRPVELAFKLYPWEWMFHDAFRRTACDRADALDRAAVESDSVQQGYPSAAVGDVSEPSEPAAGLFRGRSERSQARHILCQETALFAEGANVALVSAGTTLVEQQGPYGAEGFIRQAMAPLPNFSDQYAVLGSWLVDHTPCGLSIREDENPITGNTSRFVPHAIL